MERDKQDLIQESSDHKPLKILLFPRFLLGMKLSSSAQAAYLLLLDRAMLSHRKGWVDVHGTPYIIYPHEKMMMDLGKSASTVKSILYELESLCLIQRYYPKQNTGRQPRIYMLFSEETKEQLSYIAEKGKAASESYGISEETIKAIAGSGEASDILQAFLLYPLFLLKSGLTQAAKTAYILLLNQLANPESSNKVCTDEKGCAYISDAVEEMSFMVEQGRANIKRILSELERNGLIQRPAQYPNRTYISLPGKARLAQKAKESLRREGPTTLSTKSTQPVEARPESAESESQDGTVPGDSHELTLEELEATVKAVVPDGWVQELLGDHISAIDNSPIAMRHAIDKLHEDYYRYVAELEKKEKLPQWRQKAAHRMERAEQNRKKRLADSRPEQDGEEGCALCKKAPQDILNGRDPKVVALSLQKLCYKSRLKDYGFFSLAGIAQAVGRISNMTQPSMWTENKVRRYAKILGCEVSDILDGNIKAAKRNFGETFSVNFMAAINVAELDVNAVIGILSKATNKTAQTIKRQIFEKKTMPDWDNAKMLMAIVGTRLEDMLDWTGKWQERFRQPTAMETAFDSTPKNEMVCPPNLQETICSICAAEGITPSNLMWAVGIESLRRRKAILKSKGLPQKLIEACANALQVSTDMLTGRTPAVAPAGVDFRRKFSDGVDRYLADNASTIGEVVALASLTPCPPARTSTSSVDSKIQSGEIIAKNNDLLLTALLTAMQLTLGELLSLEETPATNHAEEKLHPSVLESVEQQMEIQLDSRSQAESSDGSGSKKVATKAYDANGNLLELVKIDSPECLLKGEGTAQGKTRSIIQVPPDVNLTKAIQMHYNHPRIGERPWSPLHLSSKASQYLNPEENIPVQKIDAYVNGRDVPTGEVLEAIIKAFYPEAVENPEDWEKAVKKFFDKGRGPEIIVLPHTALNSPKFKMTPVTCELMRARLFEAIRKSEGKITVSSLAHHMAEAGCVEGETKNLENILAGLKEANLPSERTMKILLSVLGVTREWLLGSPPVVEDIEQQKKELIGKIKSLSLAHIPVLAEQAKHTHFSS